MSLYNGFLKLVCGKGVLTETESTFSRSCTGRLEGWTSIVVNLLLGALKLVFGIISGSIALIADAFHSFSDSATSVVVVVGFTVADREPDCEHPFGHGRVEAITTLVVAVLLLVAGVEIVRGAIENINHPPDITLNPLIIGVVIFSILIKELLAHFSRRLALQIDSDALAADAWHHHSDAFSSLLVLLAMIMGYYDVPYVDQLMGGLVAVLIGWLAVKILKRAANTLLGVKPEPEFLERLLQIIRSNQAVISVHDIIVNSYGERKIVSFHVEVDRNISLLESHDIAEQLILELQDQMGFTPTIHIDPVDLEDPQTIAIKQFINRKLEQHFDTCSCHDVRLSGESGRQKLSFDLTLPPDPDRLQNHNLTLEKLKEEIRRDFSGIEQVQIQLSTYYI